MRKSGKSRKLIKEVLVVVLFFFNWCWNEKVFGGRCLDWGEKF